jgi:hypothetical protein
MLERITTSVYVVNISNDGVTAYYDMQLLFDSIMHRNWVEEFRFKYYITKMPSRCGVGDFRTRQRGRRERSENKDVASEHTESQT